ncbi:hypothetical protein [Pseudoroseomonas cervicalis]|uniref:hypothetical protein n=1 Tax=Teichococcus cervicalis TaxID=204525 RepID=UPI0022F17A72|nr:hypothetical protein [Pseudoroseomonas cervicalis]WBV42742.1 hypothetical protein PFY06_16080 [Pseudoroseomonas cervicalis]
MPVVNLQEMARLLDVSLPTMRDLTVRYPDMPIRQRGGAGTPWQFEAEEVRLFITAKREEEVEAERARSAELAQLSLLDAGLREPSERELSSKELGQEIKNARELDKLKLERSILLDKSQIRFLLDRSWRELTQALGAMPVQMGRRHNLPDAVVRDMRRFVQDQQTVLRDRLVALLSPELRDGDQEEGADEEDPAQPDTLC